MLPWEKHHHSWALGKWRHVHLVGVLTDSLLREAFWQHLSQLEVCTLLDPEFPLLEVILKDTMSPQDWWSGMFVRVKNVETIQTFINESVTVHIWWSVFILWCYTSFQRNTVEFLVKILPYRFKCITPYIFKQFIKIFHKCLLLLLLSCFSRFQLCNPIDGSPQGFPVPGILQERTLEWVAISFSSAWKWKVKVKSLSRVRLLETLWTAAHQPPLSMGFSRQEYWSGVPLPSHCLAIAKYCPPFLSFT